MRPPVAARSPMSGVVDLRRRRTGNAHPVRRAVGGSAAAQSWSSTDSSSHRRAPRPCDAPARSGAVSMSGASLRRRRRASADAKRSSSPIVRAVRAAPCHMLLCPRREAGHRRACVSRSRRSPRAFRCETSAGATVREARARKEKPRFTAGLLIAAFRCAAPARYGGFDDERRIVVARQAGVAHPLIRPAAKRVEESGARSGSQTELRTNNAL